MRMEGLHEKEIFTDRQPFRLILNREENFSYPPHWHSAVELLYVMEGGFAVNVGSGSCRLEEGDIFFIPGGALHECRAASRLGARLFVNFDLTSLGFYGDADPLLRRLRDPVRLVPEDGAAYARAKEQFEEILQRADGASPLFYLARMIDLLLALDGSGAHGAADGGGAGGGAADLGKLDRAFEYIEKNYAADIGLRDAARAAGFSECYFSRLFGRIAEKSFRQYLSEFRIKKARMLLIDPACSVSQAAAAAGFRSLSTFDRLFRQYNGCSPQQYRRLRA